jgi:hypothetical protein
MEQQLAADIGFFARLGKAAGNVEPYEFITFDYQWINHPAYNRDRGPVSVAAIRLHAQF